VQLIHAVTSAKVGAVRGAASTAALNLYAQVLPSLRVSGSGGSIPRNDV
jgi:hypothetical protein